MPVLRQRKQGVVCRRNGRNQAVPSDARLQRDGRVAASRIKVQKQNEVRKHRYLFVAG